MGRGGLGGKKLGGGDEGTVMSIIKWRPNMGAIEDALSVVRKAEDIVQRHRQIETPSRPAQPTDGIAGRSFPIRPPSPPVYTALQRYQADVPIITDQIELPRMCASRRMPWM